LKESLFFPKQQIFSVQPNSKVPLNKIKPRQVEKYNEHIHINMIKSLVGTRVE